MTKCSKVDSVQNTFLYSCSLCDRKFKWKSEKKRHELSHDPQYSCKTCKKKFSFLSALRRHEKYHTRAEPVVCKQCGGTFRDDTLLKRHLKYAHNGESFDCPTCSASFSSDVALKTHSVTHRVKSERRYRCSFVGCDKAFNFAHHLRHHELAHTGSKQHFCAVCGKGFIQAHHLKTHMSSHEQGSWMPCTYAGCQKKFSNKYAIKRHMRTHRNKMKNLMKIKSTIKNKSSLIGLARVLCDTCGKLISKSRIVKHTETCIKKYKIKQEFTENILSTNEEEYSNTSLDDISEIVNKKLEVLVNEMSMIDLDNACQKLEFNIDANFCDDKNNCCTNTTEFINTPIDNLKTLEIEIKPLVLINNNNEIKYPKQTIASDNADNFECVNKIECNNCKNVLGACLVENDEKCICTKYKNSNEIRYSKETTANDNTDNFESDNKIEMLNIEYDNCKNVLGACLVENDEKCICAKIYNNNKNLEDKTISVSNDKCNKCDISIDDKDKTVKLIENNNNTVLNTNVNNNINEKGNDSFDQFNSCKAIFGNCIVSGNDTIGEECLCAKMYNDGNNRRQEIEDIAPFTQMPWIN